MNLQFNLLVITVKLRDVRSMINMEDASDVVVIMGFYKIIQWEITSLVENLNKKHVKKTSSELYSVTNTML